MKILVALPVYNEQLVLEKNTKEIRSYFLTVFPQDEVSIVIADNKSVDQTVNIGKKLATDLPEVEYLYLDQKGKGLAWKTVFLNYQADIYIVMDIDLAVDLAATRLLIDNIKQGYDMVIGSRYLQNSKVKRSLLRDIISITYRHLVKYILKSSINDFQCGFKALNNRVKEQVLVQTLDTGFFLDTELLVMAEKMGFKIKEIPVDWVEFRDEGRKSTVNIFETTSDYLQKVWQLRQIIKKIKQI